MSWVPCPRPDERTEDRREFRDDWITPGMVLDAGLSLEHRPDAISFDYRTAFTFGPVQLGDPSSGLVDRVWRISVRGNGVYLARAGDGNSAWEPESLLFSYEGAELEEVDLAFGQNAQPVVCAQRAGRVLLYWYDPLLGTTTLADLAGGRTPRVILDNPLDVADSDVLLFYVDDGANHVVYRTQRERYTASAPTPLATTPGVYLEDVVKASDGRIRVIVSVHDPASGTYSMRTVESTLYPRHAEAEDLVASGGVGSVVIARSLWLSSARDDVATAAGLASVELAALVRVPSQPAEGLEASASVAGLTMRPLTRVPLLPGEGFTAPGSVSSLTLTRYIIVAGTQPHEDVSTSGSLTGISFPGL